MRKLRPNSPATSTAGESVRRPLTRALAILPDQDLAEPLQRLLVSGFRRGLIRRLYGGGDVGGGARDIGERFSLEFVQMSRDPLVDAVGEQQHLHTAGAEALEVRAVARSGERVGGQVIDGFLVRPSCATRNRRASTSAASPATAVE